MYFKSEKSYFKFFIFALIILSLGVVLNLNINKTDNAIADYSANYEFSFDGYRANSSSWILYFSPVNVSATLEYSAFKYDLLSGSLSAGGLILNSSGNGVSWNATKSTTFTYDQIYYTHSVSTMSNVYIQWIGVYRFASGNVLMSETTNYGINSTETTHSVSSVKKSFSSDFGSAMIIITVDVALVYQYYINGTAVRVGTGSSIIPRGEMTSKIYASSNVNVNSYQKTGYTLAGFYSSDGLRVIDSGGSLDTAYTPGSSLTPRYNANTYTINYNGNGNTGGSTESSSHTYDTAKALTSNGFTKTGYRFIGWSTSANGSVVYSNGQSVKNLTATNGGTVNLYAQWAPITYSVAFDANGGDGESMSNQSFTYDASQNLTKNSFTRTGHTFAGWNTEKNGTGTSYSDNASVSNLTTTNNATVTLYAQWTAQNLKANFNYNGGTVVRESDSQYYSSNGTFLSGIPTDDEMSKTGYAGYTFKGWSLTPNDTGAYYDSNTDWNDITVTTTNGKGSCSVSDKNVGNIEFTLYAIWEANDYKISYELNDGSPGSSHPTTAKYDSVVNISNPTKEGYTFTGWTASGLSNTAKSGTSDSLSALKTWNGSATKNTYFANLTANPGTVQNGVQIAYATVTLTANWTANTYTINYSLGDDTTYPANLGSNAPTSATYDDVAIEISTPTRVGYVFAGWTLSGDNIITAQSGASSTNLSAWGGGVNRNRYFKNLTPDASGSVTMTATWQATIASSSITATMPAKDSNNEYYLISNINNLAWLALQGDKANVTGKFIQTNNITIPNNILWLPIGRLGSFSGTYDGQGYTISGLRTYNGTDANLETNGNYLETNGGLFANASGATITNVIIEDAEIYGQNAGIIAGSASTNNTGSSTNISNCVVSGTVNGTNAGSIIGNGNGASIITACLAKGVDTASFAGGSASVDSCIFELNDASKTRGKSNRFNNYSDWIYPSNFAYPMPKAFMWYPYPELSEDSLNTWLGK